MTETLPSDQALFSAQEAQEREDQPQEAQEPEAPPQEQETTPQDSGLELSEEGLSQALEALLFVACDPLSAKELAKLTEAPLPAVQAALERLVEGYRERGLTLRAIAGGYQFVTPERFAFLVERLYRPKYQQLSAAALEALAIIAYKQPITRAEVTAVRQVDCDSVINTLLEKKLIREVGRVNAAGRPILYGTGQEFLSFFGLNSLSDLPRLEEEGSQQEFNF